MFLAQVALRPNGPRPTKFGATGLLAPARPALTPKPSIGHFLAQGMIPRPSTVWSPPYTDQAARFLHNASLTRPLCCWPEWPTSSSRLAFSHKQTKPPMCLHDAQTEYVTHAFGHLHRPPASPCFSPTSPSNWLGSCTTTNEACSRQVPMHVTSASPVKRPVAFESFSRVWVIMHFEST